MLIGKITKISLFLLCALSLKGQNVVWSAQHRNNASYNAKKDIEIDSIGNIFMLGASYGSPRIPYVTKFDGLGQDLWTDTAKSNFGFMRMGVNSHGSVIVLGNFIDSIDLGGIELTDTLPYSTSYYAKIDSLGSFEWAFKLPPRVTAYDVVVLTSGEFYISGRTSMIGAYIGSEYINADNGFIAKFDPSGLCTEVKIICNSYPFFLLTRDKIGNFYITGTINGTVAIGDAIDYIYASSGSAAGVLVAKFDSNLKVQWAKVGKTSSTTEAAKSIAVDSSGNVYAGGSMGFYMDFEGHAVSTSGNNMFLVKYDPNGNYQWMKYSYGISGSASSITLSHCHGMTVDVAGNSYITGGCTSDTLHFDSYVINGGSKPYLIKYDTDGNLMWGLNSEILPSEIPGEGMALCSDQHGNVYLAGNYGEYLEKSFVAKISESGVITAVPDVEASSNLIIYPNPTAGTFQVIFASVEKANLNFCIINPLGQEVYREYIPQFHGELKKEMDLGNFSKGIYAVCIFDGKTHRIKKVVVK